MATPASENRKGAVSKGQPLDVILSFFLVVILRAKPEGSLIVDGSSPVWRSFAALRMTHARAGLHPLHSSPQVAIFLAWLNHFWGSPAVRFTRL